MPNTTATTLRTCAACDSAIDSSVAVVEMSSYGIAFHPVCFTRLSGTELLHLMGEDETAVRQTDGTVLRARDARNITQHGFVIGTPELVNW